MIFLRLAIIIFLTVLPGCQWFTRSAMHFNAFTNIRIPDGTPVFKKGFRDGCSSAFYARGNDFYRSRYGYSIDGNLTGNNEYTFGLARGYSYCFSYIMVPTTGGPQGGVLNFFSNHDYDSTFQSRDIGVAWKGMFEGETWKNAFWTDGNSINNIFSTFDKGLDGKTSAFGARGLIWSGNSEGQFFGQ